MDPHVPPDAPWFALSALEVADRLDTSTTEGLTASEVAGRLEEFGPNELDVDTERPWLPVLVAQFTGPLAAILLVAASISAGLGEFVDAIAISVILVINGILGFVQEWRAGQAIDALTSMMVVRTQVVRDGLSSSIDSVGLVPGDVVEVAAGDRIPAEIRVTDAVGLMIDESALTGEPEAVHKSPAPAPADAILSERSCLLHAGTDAKAGHGRGIVVGTGAATELGTVVDLAAGVEEGEIPLQRSLGALGRSLGAVALVIAALTVFAGVISGRPVGDMLVTGISLAVAIVPEGLPAVVTVTLALGIQSMARRNALLRHLEAAETLGAASVICTDKTGTLTENRMTVRRIWTPGGVADADHEFVDGDDDVVQQLLRTAQICNHATAGHNGDGSDGLGAPTEVALLVLARNRGAATPADVVIDEIPFDSDTKAMTVVSRAPGGSVEAHVKGAPEVVLARSSHLLGRHGPSPLDDAARDEIDRSLEQMTAAGLRTLALAQRPIPADVADTDAAATAAEGLTLLGVVGLHDPPRPEVAAAVATARAAGITIVVMTGDAAGTGLSIAKEVGLPATGTLVGRELDDATDDELVHWLDGSRVLARVTPAHKMRVVRALQADGAVVAMTGDGVNDAPALEQASIGIAMGRRGTDVARQASDVVLADDNFASIVAAIDEGRRQYANIRKFIRYLLSSNLGEVIAITGSVLLGWPLILLPAQILWMNLLTDGVTALALGVEKSEPDAMTRPPRDPAEPIVDRTGMAWIAGMGLMIGVVSLIVFRLSLGDGTGDDLVRAQTLAFTVMVLMEKMNVFNFRSERQPLRAMGLFSNRWLVLAWSGAILAQVGAVYLPGLSDALGTTGLTLWDWVILTLIALPVLVVGELAKSVLRRKESAM